MIKTGPSGETLNAIYERYGFRPLPLRSTETPVFWQNLAGRHIADIISAEGPTPASDNLRHDLEKSGYSCRIRYTNDPEQLDQVLFSEFFNLKSSRERVVELYARFCRRTEISTGTPYRYKPLRFLTDTGAGKPNEDLVQQVCSVVLSKGPRLVILEAAAAFGKTCTAYEIARAIVQSKEHLLPLLAELSRNRGATEFRYILLDEISQNFSVVSANLARHQIQKGRLLLLLDGFDELLYRPGLDKPSFEDAQPMLETIRGFLQGDACILITSRKSTLLTGDAFQNWLDSHAEDFRTHRFLLDRPDPKLWISGQRRELSDRSGLPLQQLANPVLFSFLESLTEQEFTNCCINPGRIVEEYINRLLAREIDRQDLRMTVDEQKSIFYGIAAAMATENFKAEQREFFEEFIRDRFEPLLVRALTRYPPNSEHSISLTNIVEKLVHHAFLDRRLDRRELLGFQNDFILGTLVGEIITSSKEKEWVGSEEFVDLVVTAFGIRSQVERYRLWKQLQFMSNFISPNLLLELDMALRRSQERTLKDLTFSDLEVEGIHLGEKHAIANCCFVSCTFKGVTFNSERMERVTFINCRFDNCATSNKPRFEQFHGFDCSFNPASFAEKLFPREDSEAQPRSQNKGLLADKYEKIVLENFWPRGRAQFGRTRSIRTLYLGRGHEEHDFIAQAIRRLRQRNIIFTDGDRADLNLDKIDEVIALLGRATC